MHRRAIFGAFAALALALAAAGAAAIPALAKTQRVAVNDGSFSANLKWRAVANPGPFGGPKTNTLFIDLYNRQGHRIDPSFAHVANPIRPKRLRATEARPPARPTSNAATFGHTGRKVRKVRVVYVNGARTVNTVRAPADWGVDYRFFAAAKPGAGPRDRRQLTKRIIGFDRNGNKIFQTTNVLLANP